MVWFKVDDSFPSHPKVLGIPRRDRLAAVGLWTLAGGWCAKQLTDGYLAVHMVDEIGGNPRLASTLVEVGLWEVSEGGYQFHDWAEYNPTREEVENERESARERMKRVRSRRSSPEVQRSSGEVRANNSRSSEEVRLTRPDPTRPVVPDGTTKAAPKRATQLPADWKPKEDHLAIAREYNLDPAFELRKFRDHHEAKGSTMKSWDAAFRTWLNNAKTYQRPAVARPDSVGRLERSLQRVTAPRGELA